MITHLEDYREEIAFLFVRIMLGILFVIQGYDKLVNIGLKETTETYRHEIKIRFLPAWIYPVTASYSCFIEFFGGLLLLIGLFNNITLILLGADLLLVAVAMGLINPVWDMKFVFPRFLLLILLLLLPSDWNIFSIDYLMNK